VVGNICSSRESSEDRGSATGPRGTTSRRPLRRKPKASKLRPSATPSMSRRLSDSSQYSRDPVTAICNPVTAMPSRSGSLEQLLPQAILLSVPTNPSVPRKTVSFNIPPKNTSHLPSQKESSPRTGAESAARAASQEYGKPLPPFNPTALRTGFWRSAIQKSAFTNKRQGTIRSLFFPTPRDTSEPTSTESQQWFRPSTAAIPTDIDTQQGIITVPEPSKVALQECRERTGYLEAGTMRGRQGGQGRYLRAETLRKERQRRFWR
jgi:hypothetical protein